MISFRHTNGLLQMNIIENIQNWCELMFLFIVKRNGAVLEYRFVLTVDSGHTKINYYL